MTDAESVERILAEARPLALLDAACLLWRQKYELDRLEAARPSLQPYIDMRNAEMRRAVHYWEAAQYRRAMETGDDPPTVARLKQTHPAVGDDELRQAIKAAIAIEEERDRLADIARIMTEAGRLPLPDAAYYLYMKKAELDRLEPATHRPPPEPQSWAYVTQVVRQVTQQIAKERAEGYEAATFDRLKRAHPEASEAELARALRAGIKLDVDCFRHYSAKGSDCYQDVVRAIGRAKAENPGFQEATYRAAEHHLAWAMR